MIEQSAFNARIPDNVLSSYSHVAVTGGSGFVGRHLVSALANLGKSVTVVDLIPPGKLEALPSKIQFHRADLREPDQVIRGVDNAELVFHLAGNASGTVSIMRPRLDFETNALGTFNVAEASIAVRARRVIYLSSACVYGRPRSVPISEEHTLMPFLPYGATKLAGELVLRSFREALGLPVVIGRAFVIYGPGEDPRRAGGEVSQFLRWHLNDQPIRAVGDIDRKSRDFVHVSDLVSGLLTLADRAEDGEVFNLGTGQEVSLRQLAETIGAVTGKKPQFVVDASIMDDTYPLVADISRLRSLGFKPNVSLTEGLSALVLHLGEQPELPGVEVIFRRKHRVEEVA